MAGDALITDADLLDYEPQIYNYRFQHQLLAEGADGATDATGKVFTSASAGFVAAGIEAGHVLLITAAVGDHERDRVYPVAATPTKATELTLETALPVSQSAIAYAVYNFDAQCLAATTDLLAEHGYNQYYTDETREISDVLNLDAVKPVICARALEIIFSAFARAPDGFEARRAQYWHSRYRELARVTPVDWDTDDDDAPDSQTIPGVKRILRA